MRARRLLILLMMLLLLPQAQAERLTLYTRPGQVDEATPFQLRPTELSICSVTRAMGGVVVLANDDNYDSLSLYFWQDGTNHAYVSTELISRIYTILDAYSNQLITGMSTMEEQTNLSAALQELSAALSGL